MWVPDLKEGSFQGLPGPKRDFLKRREVYSIFELPVVEFMCALKIRQTDEKNPPYAIYTLSKEIPLIPAFVTLQVLVFMCVRDS